MRRTLLLLHRWLGLTAGVVFAVAALTGSILVYADELDEWLGGPRYLTTAGQATPQAISASLEQHAPGHRLLRIIWPDGGPNILSVRIAHGGRTRDLILDAGTGAVIEPRPQVLVLWAVRRAHTTLLAGDPGSYVVFSATCLSLVSLLLGLWLWWPAVRRLTTAFRVRTGRGAYVLNLDLHKALGVVAAPLLLLMCASAALFEPVAMRMLSRLLDGEATVSAWASLAARPSRGGPEITFLDAVRRAGDESGGTFTWITFPTGPEGIVEVRRAAATGSGALRIALDRHTGDVLARHVVRYDESLNARVHFGRVGGGVVRALYSVACLVGFILLPTGVVVWWSRRRRRPAAVGVMPS